MDKRRKAAYLSVRTAEGAYGLTYLLTSLFGARDPIMGLKFD